MTLRSLALLFSLIATLSSATSSAANSIDLFAFSNVPFPEDASHLIAVMPAVQLEPNEVLIEGYVLDSRRGRPIEFVAVYPGVFNQVAPSIPDALAITDKNGFFSIVVDRDQFTHLAAVCLAPSGEVASPGRFSFVVLPRAEVMQAERTFRLKLRRRERRCEFPIERPSGPVFTTQ